LCLEATKKGSRKRKEAVAEGGNPQGNLAIWSLYIC
jgi:hypothetical protein